MRTTYSIGMAGAALIGALALGPLQAAADTIDWTNWTDFTESGSTPGTATGTTGNGIGVSYTGEVHGVFLNTIDWATAGGGTTFSGGMVGNAPPSSGGIVQLFGGPSGASQTPVLNTITFSTPVTNPVMAIWSLGQSGIPASFVFNQTPALQSGGPSVEFAGNSISVTGNTVNGAEGNGTVEFLGTFQSISWTNPTYENWYGFTVGIPAAVPEPGSITLLLAGIVAVGFTVGRRNRLAAHAA